MSLKCQGDLIVAANVDKSEVIYTLIEPFHPFSRYFATVLCSSIRLCTAWIGGGGGGGVGLLRKGSAAEITAFDSVPNVFKTWQTPRSKWFRHYEQGGAGPECKALGRSRSAMHFSKSDSDALKWMKGALFPGRTDVVTELTLKKNVAFEKKNNVKAIKVEIRQCNV